MLISAFAQIVLTQRFGILSLFERVRSFSLLQNLRDNEEEQMGRGYLVHSCRRTVRHRSSELCSRRSELRSVPPIHHMFEFRS